MKTSMFRCDLETVAQLLAKASDDLDLFKRNISIERQHDNCGHHLGLATEKILKAIHELAGIQYSRDGKSGHSLRQLFSSAEKESGFGFVADYRALSALEIYGSSSRYDYVMEDDRLNPNKYHGLCQALFGETLREYKKLKNQ